MNTRAFMLIALLACALLAPAFVLGAGGGDLHLQSLWVRNFSEQFWQGDLYPRWLMEMFAGNGSPVFFYYPPVAYYFSALFYFLAPLDAFNYYPIAASAFCAVAASGFAFFAWMREEGVDAQRALLACACYMAMPFHVAHYYYYVLLYSSVWAYAWVPLLMLAARRLAFGRPGGMVLFSLSLGLLILTNISMTILFGPLAVAYALVMAGKARLLPALVRCGIACALGFGLGAVLLVPQVAYRHYALLQDAWENPYEGREVFLTPGFDNSAQTVYTLVWLAVLGLAVLLYTAADRVRRQERNFCLAATLCALCLILLYIGKPLMDALPVLKLLQHPARFFAVPALCISWLAAYAPLRARPWLVALVVCFVATAAGVAWESKKSMQDFRQNQPEDYARYEMSIDQHREYLTLPVLVKRYYTPEGLKDVQEHQGKVEVPKGDANVNVEEWKPRHILLRVDAKKPAVLRIRQHYFPGFRAFLNGEEVEAGFDEKTGQLTVHVPAGESELRIELSQMMPELAGRLISLASAGIIALLWLIGLRKKAEG